MFNTARGLEIFHFILRRLLNCVALNYIAAYYNLAMWQFGMSLSSEEVVIWRTYMVECVSILTYFS